MNKIKEVINNKNINLEKVLNKLLKNNILKFIKVDNEVYVNDDIYKKFAICNKRGEYFCFLTRPIIFETFKSFKTPYGYIIYE